MVVHNDNESAKQGREERGACGEGEGNEKNERREGRTIEGARTLTYAEFEKIQKERRDQERKRIEHRVEKKSPRTSIEGSSLSSNQEGEEETNRRERQPSEIGEVDEKEEEEEKTRSLLNSSTIENERKVHEREIEEEHHLLADIHLSWGTLELALLRKAREIQESNTDTTTTTTTEDRKRSGYASNSAEGGWLCDSLEREDETQMNGG